MPFCAWLVSICRIVNVAEATPYPKPIHLMTEVTSVLGSFINNASFLFTDSLRLLPTITAIFIICSSFLFIYGSSVCHNSNLMIYVSSHSTIYTIFHTNCPIYCATSHHVYDISHKPLIVLRQRPSSMRYFTQTAQFTAPSATMYTIFHTNHRNLC